MEIKPNKAIEELLDYLPDDEKIVSSYHLGFYDIMTTTERVILLRRFPKSFAEVLYEDIDSLEHVTRIKWGELVNGAFLTVIGVLGYGYNSENGLSALIEDFSGRYLPEFSKLVPSDKAALFVIVLLTLLGLHRMVNFVSSLWGYFRISRKGRAPVMIHTSLTPEVRELIREIEAHVKKKGKGWGMPLVAQPVPVASAEESRNVVFKKLGDNMKGLENNAILIITSQSKDHMQVVSSMLRILIEERGMGGVYLSISRPYEYIMSAMSAAGVNSKNVFFIDCISKMAGKSDSKNRENIFFVENPSSLEEVSMYVDRMLSKVENKNKFLFLDSIDSLLIYNNDKSVKEFTHYIINKVRLEGTAGIILSIEKKEAEDLIKTLVPMCDLEIKV